MMFKTQIYRKVFFIFLLIGIFLVTSCNKPVKIADFNVVVLVDVDSEMVTEKQAEVIVSNASDILMGLTNFGIKMVDYEQAHFDDKNQSINDLVRDYMGSNPAVTPNGFIIFSYGDDNLAKSFGGYLRGAVPGSNGYVNNFISENFGHKNIYPLVIHYGHQYAQCGYNGGDILVKKTSSNGECSNASGVACVMHNGYSMCNDATKDLYASSPTYFSAGNIVHEMMHVFGVEGNYDHYGTSQCKQRMGWTDPNWEIITSEFQKYNGICPDVYDDFINSYRVVPSFASRGNLKIDASWQVDLDGNSGTEDIWFKAASDSEMYLTPVNGAKASIWGNTEPRYDQCYWESKSKSEILLKGGSSILGSQFVCYETESGHIGALRVNAFYLDLNRAVDVLEIEYQTWDIPK